MSSSTNPSLDEVTPLYDVTAITTSTSQWAFWWRPITKAWFLPFSFSFCVMSQVPRFLLTSKGDVLQDQHHRGKSQCKKKLPNKDKLESILNSHYCKQFIEEVKILPYLKLTIMNWRVIIFCLVLNPHA